VGQEIGRCNEIVQANQWLLTMVALMKGDSNISSADVYIVSLAILRGLSNWLDRNEGTPSIWYMLKLHLDNAIQELERWKPQLAADNQ